VAPNGESRTVSRNTLDRWVRSYRQHGLAGLRDRPRSDQGSTRRHAELIEEAVKLRLEQPARSAAHIAEILSQPHLEGVNPGTTSTRLQKSRARALGAGNRPSALAMSLGPLCVLLVKGD